MKGRIKAVYILGPITGIERYWEAFEEAEDDVSALGYVPLSPSRLPYNLSNEQRMRISFAMIDAADAVLLLRDWYRSSNATLERDYCYFTDKLISTDLAAIEEALGKVWN